LHWRKFNSIYFYNKKYYENNKLINIFKSLARLRRMKKLDVLKIKLSLFNTNEEIKCFIDDLHFPPIDNFLIEFITYALFQIETKKFHLKINVDNLKDFLLHCFKNDIEKFTYRLNAINFHVYHLKCNFMIGYRKIDTFIFDALYGEYLIFDKNTQTFIYRFGDFSKCINDGNISKSIIEQLFIKNKHWLEFFIELHWRVVINSNKKIFQLNKVHIYNIYKDYILYDRKNVKYKERKYFYFGNIEKVIFPFELEIKDEIFTEFINRSETVTLDERDFGKYDLENMLINF